MNLLISLILTAALAIGFPPRSLTEEFAGSQMGLCEAGGMIFWEEYHSGGEINRYEFYLLDETLIAVVLKEAGTFVVYSLQPNGSIKRYSTAEEANAIENGPCGTAERIVKSRKSI